MIRALLWLPACAQMALIFGASSVPGDQLPGTVWDKLAHFAVYGLLGLCFLLPLAGGRLSGVTVGRAAAAVLLASVYGISDEMHQSFTPNRSSDVYDVFADAIGAAAAVVVALLLATWWARRRAVRRR